MDQVDLKEWDRLIHLNLTSAYMFSMAVLPYMKEKKHGKICNVSSGSGIIGDNTDVHYASAKAGLIGMTKEMATELMPFSDQCQRAWHGLDGYENVSQELLGAKEEQYFMASCG